MLSRLYSASCFVLSLRVFAVGRQASRDLALPPGRGTGTNYLALGASVSCFVNGVAGMPPWATVTCVGVCLEVFVLVMGQPSLTRYRALGGLPVLPGAL